MPKERISAGWLAHGSRANTKWQRYDPADPHPAPMGTPPPADHRAMSLTLPPELARHLDRQSTRFAVSKAAYLRMLLVRDLEAQTRSTEA